MLWLVANALASPLAVVALGDGLVAGPPAGAEVGDPTVPGGWVPVLADCLEERAPQRFTVVDRASPGETVASARGKVAGLKELAPAWVVVALGARELADETLDPAHLEQDLSALLGELRPKKGPPKVLVVGVVPPTLAQVDGADPARQAAFDERTAAANKALGALAGDGVRFLDLASDWPKDAALRAALTARGWSLSDQGHARVAAAVCDAVLR